MSKPRNLMAARLEQCGEEDCKELHIWIDAHKMGGSCVRVSACEATRIGRRLIEMSAYVRRADAGYKRAKR